VVGSVASRLWEVVKGNATWGFYYPVSIVKGVGNMGSSREEGQKEQQQQEEEETVRRISGESSRGVLMASNSPQDHGYTYTPMANNPSTSPLPQRPSSSSSRRSTLSTPGSPAKSRRRANTSFTRNNNKKPTTTNNNATIAATTIVPSSLKDIDTDSGLRASWVLVPQQEFTPTTASLPSSTTRSRAAPAAPRRLTNPTHSRSASTTHVPGKKRPFRYPVYAKPTNAHVSFEVPGIPGGRRGRKKSLSWGGAGGLGEEQLVFGVGAGGRSAGVGGLGEEVDEVDESMRRWNERLREMIREGREALGSKVEVVYEDGI